MNLDPVDIFGETLTYPIRRALTYGMAMVIGGWLGEITVNIDRREWQVLGWNEITSGFMAPVAILFSSAGPLVIAGLLLFVITTWQLGWQWIVAVAGTSAVITGENECDLGWAAWGALNLGLAGIVWLHATHRRNQWAREIFELGVHNSIQRARREQEADSEDGEPETEAEEKNPEPEDLQTGQENGNP